MVGVIPVVLIKKIVLCKIFIKILICFFSCYTFCGFMFQNMLDFLFCFMLESSATRACGKISSLSGFLESRISFVQPVSWACVLDFLLPFGLYRDFSTFIPHLKNADKKVWNSPHFLKNIDKNPSFSPSSLNLCTKNI